MSALLWNEQPRQLCISRSEIHVWRLDLNTINCPKDLGSILSYEELKRVKSLIFQCDRYRYQVTHHMKRTILANYLSCDPKCLLFEIGKQGKPFITNLQNFLSIQFNISHSYNLILIAITLKYPIGIDVEYHNKKIPLDKSGKIVFSPLEKVFFSLLKCHQEKEKAFFRCWTRKEAYLKAKGFGLMVDLASISIDLNEFPVRDELKILTPEKEEAIPCKFIPIDMDSSYITAVVATLFFQKHLSYFDAKYFYL